MRAALLLSVLLAAGCVTAEQERSLANARASDDFATYQLQRVGLLPFEGEDLSEVHANTLQQAFLLELGHSASFELVRLSPDDMEEVRGSQPYRRGTYRASTLLELADRYRLDAVLVSTVTQINVYPPQALGLSVDLVSTETGMVIWTASLQMDASDSRVRRQMERFQQGQEDVSSLQGAVQLTLISPSRFARFAAHELAKEL